MHFKHLLLFLSVSQLVAYDLPYRDASYDNMLKGYELIPKTVSNTPLIPQDLAAMFKAFFQPYVSNFKPLAWADGFKAGVLEYGITEDRLSKEYVMDLKTPQELEMVRGSSTDDATVIRKLTSLSSDTSALTILGQKRCAEMVSMPVTNMNELQTRRDCIKAFYDNQALLDEVAVLLKKIKEAEPYIIDFCGRDGVSDVEKAAYPTFVIRALGLDDTAAVVDFTNRLWIYNATPLLTPTVATAGALILAMYTAYGMDLPPNFATLRIISAWTMRASWNINTTALLAQNIIMTLLAPATLGTVKAIYNGIKHMQERTIGYATYMRAAQRLMALISENPELTRLIPDVEQQLRKLNGEDESSSDTFFTINDLLMSASTFNEGEPSVFSSPGNVLIAYKYLSDKKVRNEYSSIIHAIADIEVYAVLAQKMHAHAQSTNTPFCFVEFIENSDKPVLDIQNFWHPFISEKHAVPNSIVLNQEVTRNMLITGPNTGGKSTNMKAMAISVLLAQSFGIAPASSMRMTPFSVICTYLNVIDDTSAGLSLFKAEVKRVQELMDAVKNLPAGKFAFVMLDEIFTGTSPDKAEELSYGFMKKLSELAHTIFICATHFKKLTELEAVTGGVTKNYQVEVITDANGMVTKYTYKIVPGISKVSSAQQVVEETGLAF